MGRGAGQHTSSSSLCPPQGGNPSPRQGFGWAVETVQGLVSRFMWPLVQAGCKDNRGKIFAQQANKYS